MLYATNVRHMMADLTPAKDGVPQVNMDDDVIRGATVAHGGSVTWPPPPPKVAAIAAASILAKTVRDEGMLGLHAQYPHYGFDQHKGYPSPIHLAALAEHGPCPQHRRSFAPVRKTLGLPG